MRPVKFIVKWMLILGAIAGLIYNMDTGKYSRTSVARTLMARLPPLFRTRS